MLLILNDDCLEYICKYLDLKQQIVMRYVCTRLEQVIKIFWRYNSKKVYIDQDCFEDIPNKNEAFLDYLSSVNETVKILQFDRINSNQFQLLEGLNFPKITEADCNIWSDSNEHNDEDTLLITKLFPNITKLTLLSSISGKYLTRLTKVTDLDLSCCEFLDVQHFETIFSTMKLRKLSFLYYGYNTNFEEAIKAIALCRTLEEISIDDHHLLYIIDQILSFPKMHKITCCTRDYEKYLLHKITEAHGTKIHTLVCNSLIWSETDIVELIVEMTNLKKLIICDDIMQSDTFGILIDNLKNLKEFYFLDGTLGSVNDLLSLLERNDQLEVLDISGTEITSATPIGETFLQGCIAIIEKQANRRKVPLHLYCHSTGINNLTMDLPKLLLVTTVQRKLDVASNNCFLCDWSLPPEPSSIIKDN